MTNFTKPAVPAGYKEVTENEFWSKLKSDTRDIMPFVDEGKSGSYWATNNHSKNPFGWSDSYLKNGYQYVYAVLDR